MAFANTDNSIQDIFTKEFDGGFSMLMEDYRHEDGTGLIQFKRETHLDLDKLQDESQKEFKKTLDQIEMIKYGLTDKELAEKRAEQARFAEEQKAKLPKRGRVRTFSKKSRKRILDEQQKLNYKHLTDGDKIKAKAITLTFPRCYPDSFEAKKILQKFFKRITRRFPRSSAIWRLEPQKRGAPHFHILYFRLPYLEKEELAAIWGECCGPVYMDYSACDGSARPPRTRIETVRSCNGCMSYMAKYISKTAPDDRSDKALSDPFRSAGLVSVPYMTAGRMKIHFSVFEDCLERARVCESYFDVRSCRNRSELSAMIGYAFAKYATPAEKEVLAPATGRAWGKVNRKEFKKAVRKDAFYYMDAELLMKIKEYASMTRFGLKINEDTKGFTLYVNDDCERDHLKDLIECLYTMRVEGAQEGPIQDLKTKSSYDYQVPRFDDFEMAGGL